MCCDGMVSSNEDGQTFIWETMHNKIFRLKTSKNSMLKNALVGYATDNTTVLDLYIEWLQRGGGRKDMPKEMATHLDTSKPEEPDTATLLILTQTGQFFLLSGGDPLYECSKASYMAVGTQDMAAMCLLDAGMSAEAVVKRIIERDPFSGGEIYKELL